MAGALALGAAVLLFVSAGCGERSEPTGRAVQLYPVTVTDADQQAVSLERAPVRIAPLTAGAAEILTALGAGGKVVRDGLFDRRGDVRLSRLKNIRPDLIVAASIADAAELQRIAGETGAVLYLTPDRSIRDVERAITQLGLLADRPTESRKLVRRIETARGEVAAALKGVPEVTVFVDTGFFTTLGEHTLAGDLIREAHGVDVAGPSPEPGPFDVALLRRLDPDVYVTTSDSETTLAGLRANPRTRRLNAVRSGRIVTIDAALLGPGARVGQGLQALARLLHPDAFR